VPPDFRRPNETPLTMAATRYPGVVFDPGGLMNKAGADLKQEPPQTIDARSSGQLQSTYAARHSPPPSPTTSTSSANTRNVRVSHTACLPRNGTKPPLSLRTLPVQQIGAPRWDSRVVLPRGPSSPCSLIQSQHILEWLPARLQYSSPQDRWPADILFRDPLRAFHTTTRPAPAHHVWGPRTS
jgi:hypothetical protein